METKETKIEEIDYNNVPDIGFTGFLQEAGVDYETPQKRAMVSINGSPFLRRDDPELKKYQFPRHKLIIECAL
jgi:hypothetical protein